MAGEKYLLELGLSEHEAVLYVALLKSGGLPASAIAKESGLRRTTVYPILQNLARQGFVSIYVKRGRKIFIAERPQTVAGYFEDKLKNFNAAIPILESLEKTRLQASGLRFIETVDELERFYAGILREYRGNNYAIMGNSNAWQGLDPDFFVQYRKDRAAAGIRTRILLSADSRETSPTDARLLRETKFLPAKYVFKSTMDIFDDKILVVGPDQTSLAVVIAVPAMVDIFKSSFQLMWDALPAA
ncbi:MAG: helix-turn-helix domain-containing protein [Patescibacteria group bacterium]